MNIERYEKRAKHRIAESTLNSRLSALRKFQTFMEGGEPEVGDVEDWVDQLIEDFEAGKVKASTIREYYKAVRYYFDTMNGNGDDLDHISEWIPHNDSDPGEFLRPQEWDMMRDSVKGFRDAAIIDLMYYYARRPTEIILINKEDIDMEEGTITFNILKKKDRNITVPMEYRWNGDEYEEEKRVHRTTYKLTEEGESAVNKWLPYSSDNKAKVRLDGEEMEVTPLFATSHGRISYDSVWNMIKQATKDAGVDRNITPKSLRHSRATHLDWAGNSPDVISRQQLGHSAGSDVIDKYIHERDEEQVRDVMTLDDE